jgi:competence protein ComEC
MIIWSLIVSSLPWFPSALSPFYLILLAIMLVLSRLHWWAVLCLAVAIQEIRITERVDLMWAESRETQLCRGMLIVDRISSQAVDFTSGSAVWKSDGCEGLPHDAEVKLQVGPGHVVQTGDRIEGRFKISPIVGLQNPGGFDARRHALANGWIAKVSLIEGDVFSDQSDRGQARNRTLDWPDPLRGLAQALLFGEKQALDQQLLDVFETLGLSHMLAISGLHVGLVLGALWWLLGRLGWPKHPRHRIFFKSFIVCLGAYFIAYWTLFSPSVVRASVMASFISFLPMFGIQVRLYQVIALTLVGLVISDPMIALSTGFLMSAGAVLLIAQTLWASRASGVTQLLSVQVGFSCVLATVLSLWLGFAYPWLGILANVLIVPLLPLLLLFLAICVGTEWSWLIEVLNMLIDQCVNTLHWLLAHTNFGHIPSEWILGLLLIIGISVLLPKPSPRWALAILAVLFMYRPWAVDHPRLIVHDIGQGSAATLMSASSRGIFDLAAGQADRWSRIGQFLPSSRGQTIDAIFVSHGDMDHAGGLTATIQSTPIPRVIEGGGSLDGWLGSCRRLHTLGNVTVELLWPLSPVDGSENRRSCVYLLSSLDRYVLLMGDADWFSEAQIVKALHRRGLIGKIDAVVVSHHGARDGSNPSFVSLVGAKHALVSVGRANRYGHPHSDVLERWAESGATIHRTDFDGALSFDFQTGGVTRYRETNPQRWISSRAFRQRDGSFDQSITDSPAGD